MAVHKLTQRHLQTALAAARPSVTEESLQALHKFNTRLRRNDLDDEDGEDNDVTQTTMLANELSSLRATIRAEAETAISSGATPQEALARILQTLIARQNEKQNATTRPLKNEMKQFD